MLASNSLFAFLSFSFVKSFQHLSQCVSLYFVPIVRFVRIPALWLDPQAFHLISTLAMSLLQDSLSAKRLHLVRIDSNVTNILDARSGEL